jgi:hypothetical protein
MTRTAVWRVSRGHPPSSSPAWGPYSRLRGASRWCILTKGVASTNSAKSVHATRANVCGLIWFLSELVRILAV